ncbi:MAG: hypothetical protein LLG01_16165 [Planctomycetaceae bacterium]|nr:hypothetical protein [Planctomycetaceae bacterium]
METTPGAKVMDAATRRPRRATFLLALSGVFLLSFGLYAAARLFIGDDLYGGDVIALTNRRPSSYRLGPAELPDIAALAAAIRQGKTSPGTAAAEVYAALSPQAKTALDAYADSPQDPRRRETFLLEINRSLLDQPIEWPPALVGADEPQPARSDVEQTQQRNFRVLRRLWPSLIASPGDALGGPGGEFRRAFTMTEPLRYTPLTNLYRRAVLGFLVGHPSAVTAAVAMMAAMFAAMVAVVFILCRMLTDSTRWGLLATLFFAAASSTVISVQMLFSLPYLLVTLTMSTAFVAYLRYRTGGHWLWLAVFAFFAVLAPWCREFAAATAFVAAVSEIIRFRGRRSIAVILVCLPLMVHAAYPSLLPWLLGWNGGHVYGMFDMEKLKQQQSAAFTFWHLFGFVFVQMPPLLWLLAGAAMVWWLLESRGAASSWRRRAAYAGAASVAGAYAAFAYSFYVANAGLEHFAYLKWGPALAGPMIVLGLLSLRFNALAPVCLAALLAPLLRVQVAEIHLTFLTAPLAILITLWLRDLIAGIRTATPGRGRTLALAAVVILAGIGTLDQVLNIPATCRVQRELVRGNVQMGRWIRETLPRHSIVVANFFNVADVYRCSDYHVDPYETVENCPMGAARVVYKDEDFLALCRANAGIRKIYLLEAEHPFFSWQQAYHSHKYVRKPPGPLVRRQHWPGRHTFFYADPLKRLTPRFWVSFPGYMDWGTDFWYDQGEGMFRRIVRADYSLYEMTVGSGN